MENNFDLSRQLAFALVRHHLTLVVAESCTGGGLAYQFTSLPDCSSWLERGFITYSNASKTELLDVSPKTLAIWCGERGDGNGNGKGAIKHSDADISLSITGIAGPSGGNSRKPVGTVYFGLADRGGLCRHRLAHFSSGRHQIRVDAITFAIRWLLEHVNSKQEKIMKMNSDKQKALSAAKAQIERQFGKGSLMCLGDGDVAPDIEAVSTGSIGLDIALGIGGLPRGRIVEIYGPESSGKTTLTLEAIASCQRLAEPLHLLTPSMPWIRCMLSRWSQYK